GAETNAALVVLADQPFVRPETLNKLIACHEQSRPQIIIPMYKGFRGNPVLLDRVVFPELSALSGDVGCRAIFGSHTENIHKLELELVNVFCMAAKDRATSHVAAQRAQLRKDHTVQQHRVAAKALVHRDDDLWT